MSIETWILGSDDIQKLKGCPQDPEYHKEGDVYVHTMLVLNELRTLLEKEIKMHTIVKKAIEIAALFHDSGKPYTTREENGRITSKNHAIVGSRIIYNFLLNHSYAIGEGNYNDCTYEIIKLVEFHGAPLWIMEKENPYAEMIKLSAHFPLKYLYLLAKADVLGRYCADKENLLFKVEFFKEYAQELGIFENKNPISLSSLRYFLNKGTGTLIEYPHIYSQTETINTVILLCGLPASGKDFYIESEHFEDCDVISLDKIREELKIKPSDIKGQGKVIQLAKERAKVYLRKKQDFIWNATNLSKTYRRNLINLFDNYGFRTNLYFFCAPEKIIKERNNKRKEPVPEKVINKMLMGIDIPDKSEAASLNFINNFDNIRYLNDY